MDKITRQLVQAHEKGADHRGLSHGAGKYS
jgi:hypothetical protein